MKRHHVLAVITASSILFSTDLAAQSESGAAANDGLSDVCELSARRGPRWDNRALRPLIEGTWKMQAMGSGYTTGTNIETLTIKYDVGGRSFYIDGGPRLHPLAAMPGDHPLRRTDILSMEIDGSQVRNADQSPAINPYTDQPIGGLSLNNMALMDGCADARQIPMLFWGNASSWGFVAFTSSQFGVGQMGNSARGSRNLSLTR